MPMVTVMSQPRRPLVCDRIPEEPFLDRDGNISQTARRLNHDRQAGRHYGGRYEAFEQRGDLALTAPPGLALTFQAFGGIL
jgi:hypothetical protein